ncbi:hypothetical protein [Paenibacillus sp. NRS-1760]|uniref:hypothetical protein n=1 Tax=Paenibacillus sp. NRS-1760 TaxID=3233902 RepID=UPI003D283701
MHILDIDLDFFLNQVAHNTSDEYGRLDGTIYIPWTDERVRTFLEVNCGLSKDSLVPGKFVRSHHEAFYFWKELIENGELVPPFSLVNVDAHLDTGGWGYYDGGLYIINELSKIPPGERHKHIKHMDAGNYISFVVACNWTDHILFVLHPEGNGDITSMLAKDLDPQSNYFEIRNYIKHVTAETIHSADYISVDTEVPFKILDDIDKYREDLPFDFIVLSQSPGFTPETSDTLIPIILEYIELIN